jgi:hypothetical protein
MIIESRYFYNITTPAIFNSVKIAKLLTNGEKRQRQKEIPYERENEDEMRMT